VDKLGDAAANSITLSAGGNFIPIPFSAASGDPTVAAALQAFYAQLLNVDPAGLASLTAAVGRVDVAVLNGIGIQATTIGNHDSDFGFTILADAIDMTTSGGFATSIGALFPYLSANLDFSGDPALRGLYTDTLRDAVSYVTAAADLAASTTVTADQQIAPWTTIQEGGQTIGVLAVTTQLEAQLTSLGGTKVKDPAGDGGVDNLDEVAGILQPLIDQMTAQGINKIVLLSQLQQYTNELQLVAKLSGVEVIVAGGSHAIFADGTEALRRGNTTDQGYPQFVTGADGNPVAVVSTGNEYSYVGLLVMTFDQTGVIVPGSVNPAVSGAYAITDKTVAALWSDEDPYAGGHARRRGAPAPYPRGRGDQQQGRHRLRRNQGLPGRPPRRGAHGGNQTRLPVRRRQSLAGAPGGRRSNRVLQERRRHPRRDRRPVDRHQLGGNPAAGQPHRWQAGRRHQPA
jgi:2',3'-cyclic-nucleotide 2'-phosphodiesterase (5'-nucleotidase family)